MNLRTDLLIDGEWISTNEKTEVLNPANGTLIGEVSLSTPELEMKAMHAAQRAAESWASTSPRLRSEILRKSFELMVARADEIAQIISMENGKVLADAKGEALYAAEFFRWFSEEAVRINGEFRQSPSGDKRMLLTRQPVGVSLLITPWNFPAAMATRKLGPALAAGCTVILKPATETPLTALAIADLMVEAGLPAGVVNIILPKNVGESISRLIANPILRNISFTGSTSVGKLLLKQAAERVVRCSMELGGNAPLLVLEDADVDVAVAGALVAKMRNGGAACTAANRFYVHESVADEFIEKFAQAMSVLKMGEGTQQGSQLGASVSILERDKIADLVEISVKSGGEVVVGGKKSNLLGAFYEATVLKVESTNPILEQEIFGPVAPIVVVKSTQEAIELANRSSAGLISYVFSKDFSEALRVAEKLESGMVAINRGVISDPAATFGGVKESGLGREGGFDGIHEFLEAKYIGANVN
jgi:succinate-semialdehyde dehydrogenase/glutarate-semialdehyde dehydrogenase